MEEKEPKENSIGGGSGSSNTSGLTLQKAVDLGEFNPEFLGQFPEWHKLTRHVQFEYIRKAIENRNRQLIVQWSEITNILDFRLKPHLREALKNIEDQLQNLQRDKERLYVKYSTA